MVALQALSGTGSLRVGAAFIAKFLPGTKVYLSNPTWGNHNNIFADAGVPAEKYRCCTQRPSLSLLKTRRGIPFVHSSVMGSLEAGLCLKNHVMYYVVLPLSHLSALGHGHHVIMRAVPCVQGCL